MIGKEMNISLLIRGGIHFYEGNTSFSRFFMATSTIFVLGSDN